ncbi:MAG: septal ring lytic transglycosylase RlpA family protein [Cyanobium sp.]
MTIPIAMRVLHLLGSAGLLIAGAAFSPAYSAAVSSPSFGALSIREAGAPSRWENNFIKLTPPVPLAQGLQIASARSVQVGQASWYGPGFFGNRTASGEVFRPGTLTAAHRYLPFGTKVRVTNLYNGRSAVVRINDRGPFSGGRIIDLAHGAAQVLGLTASGVADVRLEVID